MIVLISVVGFEKLVVIQMIIIPRERYHEYTPLLSDKMLEKNFRNSTVNVCVMDMNALKEFYGETIIETEKMLNTTERV